MKARAATSWAFISDNPFSRKIVDDTAGKVCLAAYMGKNLPQCPFDFAPKLCALCSHSPCLSLSVRGRALTALLESPD